MESFHDELVGPGVTDLPERFFDRFVFNLHRTDATHAVDHLRPRDLPGTRHR